MRRSRRWMGVFSVATMLVAAGCGGGGEREDPNQEVSIGGDVSVPSTSTAPGAPAASGAPATASAPAATAAPRPTAGAPPTTSPPSEAHEPATPTTGNASTGPTGTRGGPFPALALQSTTADISIALGVEPGLTPSPEAVEHVRRMFEEIAGKRVIVPQAKPLPRSPDNTEWNIGDARSIANQRVGRYDGGPRALLRVLYVHGRSSSSETVLGFASDDLIVMFPKRIEAYATPLLPAARIEKTVLLHEAGHSFGLVDTYLNTGRDDPEHPGHSVNKRSVMYHGADTSAITTVFDGGPPTTFDADDLADLAAIRRGAAAGSRGETSP